MLADTAQVHQGKLFAMGLGIATATITQPNQILPLAICGTFTLPFTETNKDHRLQIELLDLDGQPFLVPTPIGEQAFRIEAGLRTALLPQMPRGAEAVMPFAVQFMLPMRPGNFHFRVLLNGVEVPTASLSLYIMDATGATQGGSPTKA